MPRIREHNEYFHTVSLSGRKSCPSCSEKLEPGESIWSWGNYVRIRWVTVTYFCKKCFPERVRARLNGHTNGCGCTVNLKGYCGKRLSEWLTLKTECLATKCPQLPLGGDGVLVHTPELRDRNGIDTPARFYSRLNSGGRI